jgi:hypothetical protein
MFRAMINAPRPRFDAGRDLRDQPYCARTAQASFPHERVVTHQGGGKFQHTFWTVVLGRTLGCACQYIIWPSPSPCPGRPESVGPEHPAVAARGLAATRSTPDRRCRRRR